MLVLWSTHLMNMRYKGPLTLKNLGLDIENIFNNQVSFGLGVEKLEHFEEFLSQTR
jgi:hypothetical protein